MINESQIVNYGVVKNGKVHYYKPKFVEQQILDLEGKEIGMVLFEKVPAVTEDMHGFLRGGIIRKVCMSTELFAGNSESEIYDILKEKCNFYVNRTVIFGNESFTKKDYLHMDTCGKRRGKEFIDAIIRFLAEHDIIVPDPSEFLYNKYKSTHGNKRKKEESVEHDPAESEHQGIYTPMYRAGRLFILSDY